MLGIENLGILHLIVGLVASLAYSLFLFTIGQKKRSKTLFFVFLYVPIIFLFFYLQQTAQLVSVNPWIFVLLGIERIFWGFTLKEIASDEKVAWFYVVSYLPAGWVLYHLTRLDE